MNLSFKPLVFLFLGLAVSLEAEIRKFDQATIEKLGVAIYEQDSVCPSNPCPPVWRG